MILKYKWLHSTKMVPLRLPALKFNHNSLSIKSISHFSENNKGNPKDDSEENKEKKEEKSNFQKIFEKNIRIYNEQMEKSRQSLIVLKKEAEQKYNDTKKLRDTILFEEILAKNIDIVLYDCLGYVYRKAVLKDFIPALILTILSIWIYWGDKEKKLNRNILRVPLSLTYMLILWRWRIVRKLHIEKIVYHTDEKKFSLYQKSFFGKSFSIKIHKNNLLFTNDPMLNKKGINFINMENLALYKIGYVYAWKEKALFAYLIGQNIK